MERKELLREWMLAHIRLECKGDCASWTEAEVFNTFCVLRCRITPFEEWAQAVNGAADETSVEDRNEAALKLIEADKHPAVKVA